MIAFYTKIDVLFTYIDAIKIVTTCWIIVPSLSDRKFVYFKVTLFGVYKSLTIEGAIKLLLRHLLVIAIAHIVQLIS